MRCVPNMIVASPMNEKELRNMMFTAASDTIQTGKQAFTIRYPRGEGVMPNWRTPFETIDGLAKHVWFQDGTGVAILTIGHIGNYAVKATAMLKKEGLQPAHVDMRFVKPLDEVMLHAIFQRFDRVITVEDGCLMGGFGSAVLEFMVDHWVFCPC